MKPKTCLRAFRPKRTLLKTRAGAPLSRRIYLPALLSLSLGAGALQAETILTWGPNGAGIPTGGDGTWDLLAPNWTPNNGGSYQAWPTVGGDDTTAVIASSAFGSGGMITVNGSITARGLRFLGTNYTLQIAGPGNALTLASSSGFAPRIGAELVAETDYIAGPLAGTTGLTVDGRGELRLSGANSITGGLNVSSGTLTLLGGGSFVSTNSLVMGGTTGDGGAMGGRGTFIFDNSVSGASNAQTFASVQVASGEATVKVLGDTSVMTTNLTFGSQSRTVGSTLNFVSQNGTNGTTTNINLTSQATGFISPGTFFNGADFAYRASGGFVRAIGYGSDAGAVSVGATTSITPGANVHFKTTGAVSAQTTATFTTLNLGGNFTLGSGATLTVGGILRSGAGVTMSGGTGIQGPNNAELVLRTDGTSTLSINTSILANGTNSLVKSGGGVVVLGVANSYTGTTYVNGGALRLGNAVALPSASNVQLNGGVLELTSSSPTSFATGTLPGQVQWTGDGGFAAFGANVTLTLNGGAALAWGPGFVPEGNSLMLSSQTSNRTLTLANNIDLGSGVRTIEVNQGTGPAFPAANGMLAGVVSGTGSLQVVGGGVLSLTAANTFSGGVRVLDSTLIIANDNALGTGTLTVGGAGFSPTIMGNSAARTIANNIYFSNGPFASAQINGDVSSSLSLNGVIGGDPEAGFIVSTLGTVTINGDNTVNGEVNLGNGTVIMGHDHAFGTGRVRFTGAIIKGNGTPHTIANTATFMNFEIGGTSDVTFSGTLTNEFIADPTVTISNTGTTTFNNIGLADTSLNRTVTFSTSAGVSAFINGVISNGTQSTASALTKAGAGTLTIGGANTYGGKTIISGGVLSVSVLANGGAVSSVGKSNNSGSNLIINGGTLRYTGAGGSTDRLFQVGATGVGLSGTVDASGTGALLFANTGSLPFGTNNQTRTLVLTGTSTANNTLASALNNNGSGAVSLTKNGTGTWLLTANNAFTGATTVNAGTLKLGAAGSAGNTPLGTSVGATTVASGGTLDLNGFTLVTAEPLTLSGAGASGVGALINGSGTGVNYAGVVTMGSGGGSIGGSGTMTLTSALAANANALTKVGAGTLILNVASTRTGSTEIDGGVLKTANVSALGTTAQTLTLGGGSLDLATDASSSAYNTVVTGASTIFSDKATASSAGITHTLGTLSIGGQTLTIAAGANVGSGTAGVTFGGTTLTASGANFHLNTGARLTLGALNDGGTARTLNKTGTGTLVLGSAAASLVDGTAVNISEGTVQANNATALGALANVTLSTGATLSLGASETLGALNGDGGSVDVAANTLTIGAANNLASDFGGAISGSGGIIKAGSGMLELAGANLYGGTTLVNAGKLVVSGSISASSLTTVSSGATLGGSGTVGTTQVAGTLAPGMSPGVLNISGNLTMQSGSTLEMEIGGLAHGTEYDGLQIAGSFAFGGTLSVSFIGGFTAVEGNTFDLFNFAGSSGAFSSLVLPDLDPGLAWDTSALVSQGEIAVVPEPGVGAILLGGVSMLLAVSRRRR